jgi:putative transposase
MEISGQAGSVLSGNQQFEAWLIIQPVSWYLRYPLSYRDLEEMFLERGLEVDHSTVNRWVLAYASLIEKRLRRFRKPHSGSVRIDETYVCVKGQWRYLYRAIDKFGKTLDFRRRNKAAATKFFARAVETNGMPRKIVIDKSGANTAGINEINRMLTRFCCPVPIEIVRIKYLNNIVEQDHRFIKRRTRPMLGFKSFEAAASTLAGIEVASMIRKGQFVGEVCPFKQFANFAV